MRALLQMIAGLVLVSSCGRAFAERLVEAGEMSGLTIGQCTGIAQSSDGAAIAAINNTELVVWDAASGAQRGRAPLTSDQGAMAVAFAPDGKRVAVGLSGRIGVYSADRVEPVETIPVPGAVAVQAIAFSPDGKWLAVSDGRETVFDVATRAVVARIKPPKQQGYRLASDLAFSPDGKWLAMVVAGKQKGLELYSTGNWERKAAMPYPAEPTKVVFFPDSQRLATGAVDRTIRIHLVGEKPVALVRQWVAHSGTKNDDVGYVSGLAITGDGALLISVSDDTEGVRVWDPATGVGRASAHHKRSRVGGFSLAPDGKSVLVGGMSFRRLQRFTLER